MVSGYRSLVQKGDAFPTPLLSSPPSFSSLTVQDGKDGTGCRLKAWRVYLVYAHIAVLYLFILLIYWELHIVKESVSKLEENQGWGSLPIKDVPADRASLIKEAVADQLSPLIKEALADRVSPLIKEALAHKVSIRSAPSRRGKQHKKCRCPQSFKGPLLMHLRGALPELEVRDGGVISPWITDIAAVGDFALTDNSSVLLDSQGGVVIAQTGLYFIYAQVYYLTSQGLNSFTVMRKGRGGEAAPLATCSVTNSSSATAELSCFTATASSLRKGDRVYLRQREKNRRLLLRQGQTFLGLILLHNKQGSDTHKHTNITSTPHNKVLSAITHN